jgi:hypothetical protein
LRRLIGVARYNWQTGKWEWGEPPSRPRLRMRRGIAVNIAKLRAPAMSAFGGKTDVTATK